MVITTLTPRMIRAILPRPLLSGALILGNAGTLELNCDCYSKSESDGRYYTRGQADAAFARFSTESGLQNLNLQVIDIDSRVTTLEGSPLAADISVNSVATGDWLTLVGGSSGTRIHPPALVASSRTRAVDPFASSCSLAKPVLLRTAPTTPPVAALVTEINLL